MRKMLLFCGALLLVLVAPVSMAESCSCTAPDGSCSASVSCTGGCMAICGSGGNCSSSCSGGGGGKPEEEHQGLRSAPGELRVAPGGQEERITVDALDLAAEDVSALLSNLSGREITFVPNLAGERLSITAKNFPVGQLISGVAEYGAVGHQPLRVSAGHLGLDERVSLQAKKVTAEALVGMVESLSGGRAAFIPADPTAPISMEVKGVRLGELLASLTNFGQVVVDGQRFERP